MAVLIKINLKHKITSSTLMETLVATVLIILIFMLASMILNNLFSNTIKNDTQAIDNHLNQLEYLQHHEQVRIPYTDTFQNWDITIVDYIENNQPLVEFEAVNIKTNKTIKIIKSEDQ
jgi:predicted PurR-regulated permease PerM